MPRFPVLLRLALLALVLGRPSGTAPVAAELAFGPGLVQAGPEHALPATPRVYLAPALVSRGDRDGTRVSPLRIAPTDAIEPVFPWPRTATLPEPAPPAPRDVAGALAYFPTGPPLLV